MSGTSDSLLDYKANMGLVGVTKPYLLMLNQYFTIEMERRKEGNRVLG